MCRVVLFTNAPSMQESVAQCTRSSPRGRVIQHSEMGKALFKVVVCLSV